MNVTAIWYQLGRGKYDKLYAQKILFGIYAALQICHSSIKQQRLSNMHCFLNAPVIPSLYLWYLCNVTKKDETKKKVSTTTKKFPWIQKNKKKQNISQIKWLLALLSWKTEKRDAPHVCISRIQSFAENLLQMGLNRRFVSRSFNWGSAVSRPLHLAKIRDEAFFFFRLFVGLLF